MILILAIIIIALIYSVQIQPFVAYYKWRTAEQKKDLDDIKVWRLGYFYSLGVTAAFWLGVGVVFLASGLGIVLTKGIILIVFLLPVAYGLSTAIQYKKSV